MSKAAFVLRGSRSSHLVHELDPLRPRRGRAARRTAGGAVFVRAQVRSRTKAESRLEWGLRVVSYLRERAAATASCSSHWWKPAQHSRGPRWRIAEAQSGVGGVPLLASLGSYKAVSRPSPRPTWLCSRVLSGSCCARCHRPVAALIRRI
jgi:hypothetical protein